MFAHRVAVAGFACFFGIASTVLAVTPQGPGEHSSICTSDGELRDDEFAKMVADAIKASGNTPSSVKVFFNSCYGGGMLDDLAGALGPANFPPNGIPFIGASASDSDQPAWGPQDGYASSTGSGSFWTNGFADGVTNATPGQSVTGTVSGAHAADPTAPGGAYAGSLPAGYEPENPQTVTANGGAGVNWAPGAESVVFGGSATNVRHGNNVSNVEDSFLDMWGGDANSNVRSTGMNPNGSGSTADLQNMITGACNDINPGEELVIYVDDHGNTEFDVDEWWNWFTGQFPFIDPFAGWKSETPAGDDFKLHDGWEQGLRGTQEQGEPVNPGLNMALGFPTTEPFPVDSFFDVFYDGLLLPLPPVVLPGEEVFIPMPPDMVFFAPGPHMIEIMPAPGSPPAPFPLEILNLELTSGPINEIQLILEVPFIPGDLNGDGYVGSADLDIVRANWGQNAPPGELAMGDASGDGHVGSADLDIVRAHWGEGAAAIPEPGAWLLMMLFGTLALSRRR